MYSFYSFVFRKNGQNGWREAVRGVVGIAGGEGREEEVVREEEEAREGEERGEEEGEGWKKPHDPLRPNCTVIDP